MGKITPIPFEWANYFLEKDMTPSASLTFVQQALNKVIITNTVAFDPLLNWLRAASCKEKGNQRSPTDTPTTTHWLPSFPNEEETRWASVRMNSIFSTTRLKTVSTLSERPHRTHATITDNDRQAKMISQAVAATLMTMVLLRQIIQLMSQHRYLCLLLKTSLWERHVVYVLKVGVDFTMGYRVGFLLFGKSSS